MLLRHSKRRFALLLASALIVWVGLQTARADDLCCSVCCQKTHCPPPLHHCREGSPRICWQCGCPKPICNPCDQPNWGYYQTCWTPWPWSHNWSHCPVPPPAALVFPGQPGQPGGVIERGPTVLPPPPRRVDRPGL